MNIEEQRFMAREGVITWAKGVVQLAQWLSDWCASLGETLLLPNFKDHRAEFERNRLFFLTAAHMLFQYRDWAEEVGAIVPSSFSDIDKFMTDVKMMRNTNTHIIKYFSERGRWPSDWWHESKTTGKADASSTFETKIGGRLDWNEVSFATSRLLERLS